MQGPDPAILRAMEQARAGQVDPAIAALRRHAQRQPRDPAVHQALVQLLMAQGQHEQAMFHLEQMQRLAPGNPMAFMVATTCLIALGRKREAIDAAKKGVQLAPAMASAWGTLCLALTTGGHAAEAIDAGRRALQLDPRDVIGSINLGAALTEMGRVEEALGVSVEGLKLTPGRADLHSTLLISLCSLDRSPEEVLAWHRRFGEIHTPRNASPARTTPDPARRVRVGIVSGDLRHHSVAFFLRPVLEHRDRARFEVIGYQGNAKADATTQQLRALCDGWVDVSRLDHTGLDRRVRGDAIDVVLELGGHTSSSRLLSLVAKPAPVIITAIGYPHTTGVPAVDARIVDSHTDPAGAEAWATERLVRLDPCFLCYSPPTGAPEPGRSDRGDAPVFGSFNAVRKVSDRCARVWARIMQAHPDARLVLKGYGLDDESIVRHQRDRFVALGVSPDRLDIRPPAAGTGDHLKMYHDIDVALDPFPYCGTTTTCEALWMGVPVVTLAGTTHAGRVGVSLLSAIGEERLIARSEDEYVELAGALARDRARLDEYRRTLRERVRTSPLCDGPGYGRRFWTAVDGCWRDWCAAQTRNNPA